MREYFASVSVGSFLTAYLCLLIAITNPDRKDVPSPKAEGHANWHSLRGWIREDGKVWVVWIHRPDGRFANGLYGIGNDGSIIGRWGWLADVVKDQDGTVHGLTNREVLRRAVEFR